jgi:hypothetical protein
MSGTVTVRDGGAQRQGRILFATPHATDWCMVMWARSLLLTKWPEGYDVDVADTQWASIVTAREIFVRLALDGKYDWLVMACNDGAWKPDAVERLMAHGKDIVSGWSGGRVHPFLPKIFVGIDREKCLMRHRVGAGTGLERVYSIAGELAVYRTDVFRRISPPWFCGVNKPDGTPTSDDFAFGMKAYDAGVETWVDWDVPLTHRVDGMVTEGGKLRST